MVNAKSEIDIVVEELCIMSHKDTTTGTDRYCVGTTQLGEDYFMY